MAEFREALQYYYSRYDIYITFVLKFILSFFIFMEINRYLGYNELINNIFIVVILALICAITPLVVTAFLGSVIIVFHCFALDLVTGAAAFGIYLVILILIMRFLPKEAILMMLLPIGFIFRMNAAVVIGTGLLRTPVSALAMISSLISWCFLENVVTLAPQIKADELAGIDLLQQLINGTFLSAKFMMYVILFTVIILIMCLMKRIITVNGYPIAVIFGGVIYYLIRVAGGILMDIETSFVTELIFTVISAGIVLVVALFLYDINYKEGRYVQFEDDDYYYYVRAYPKNVSKRFEEEYQESRAERANADTAAAARQAQSAGGIKKHAAKAPVPQQTKAFGKVSQDTRVLKDASGIKKETGNTIKLNTGRFPDETDLNGQK